MEFGLFEVDAIGDDDDLYIYVLGFSFVFHDKAKRTQQGNLLSKMSMIADGKGVNASRV